MPLDIEELHRQASALCIKADFEAAMERWRQMLDLMPGDERAIEGVRLCEKLLAGDSLESAPPEPDSVPDVVPAETLGNRDLAIDGATLEADAAAEPAELDADRELRRRLEILLAEASDHHQQGRIADAEQVLARVLILDEQNQEALKLQQRMLEPGPPDDSLPAEPPTAESTAEFELDLADEAEGQEILPLDVLVPVESESAAAESAEEAPRASTKASAEVALAAPQASKPAKSKMALPAWAGDRRVQLGAGGVLLLVAVVLGLGWFGGEELSPVEPPVEKKVEQPVKAVEQKPQAIEQPAAPVVLTDPAVLLEEARSGVAAEDWAVAVVAYNELLQQQPDHPEALEHLPLAMERYRQQQERHREWSEAVSAFEAGEFRDALRRFYHMQDGVDVVRLNRYKANGWYNLGLMALQGNRCSTALEHFDEALVIRPADAGLLAAMALADACLDAGSPGTAVRRLELRALEG